MKSHSSAWLAVVMSALLFAGCSSTGTKDDAGASIEDRGASGAMTSGVGAGGTWTGNPLDNPNSLLYTKTIYFDFDQAASAANSSTCCAHAAYLNSNRSASVVIEGMPTSAARANTTSDWVSGVQMRSELPRGRGRGDSQLNTISYGEERPASLGHDEVSWAENRRAVLVY